MKDQPSPLTKAPAHQAPRAPVMTAPHPGPHGPWLREQRQARGWNIQQMARKLPAAGALAGDTLPATESLAVMIRRWENGSGISERYRLHYCHAFHIPPRHF